MLVTLIIFALAFILALIELRIFNRLDEPSLGLAPLMVREIFQIIRDLKGEGLGILLVEQIASYAVRICDYGYVMHQGKIFFEAERRGLMEDPNLVKAYLV